MFSLSWAEKEVEQGDLLRQQGRYREALARYLAALPVIDRILGEDHWTAIQVRLAAALCCGNAAQAARLFEQAINSLRKHGSSPALAEAWVDVAAYAHILKQPGRNESATRAALRVAEECYGANNPHVIPYVARLASLLYELCRWEEAVEVYQRLIALRRKFGSRFELAEALWEYSGVCDAVENTAEAHQASGEAKELLEGILHLKWSSSSDPGAEEEVAKAEELLHFIREVEDGEYNF